MAHLAIGDDMLDASTRKRKAQLIEAKRKKDDAKKAMDAPFPDDISMWSVEDVCRWLDVLSLSQYKLAFREASIDGDFLLNLREEDMRDVLGIEHALHRRKIIITRDKVRPLSDVEQRMKETVLREEGATNARTNRRVQDALPARDVVFSMCRNGRFKKLTKVLDAGFKIDTMDDKGNTLLITACQNLNKRMVEMLLDRRADINHQNILGNTPLHFAMAYEPAGELGEYLIERGADDMLENNKGLSPYDGLD